MSIKKGRWNCSPTALEKKGGISPRKGGPMIYEIAVELKELSEKGRDYPWKKPEKCPACGSDRLWGHGFVEAFFEWFVFALWIRRYRCPDCGCVVRMKPSGIFKRFRADIDTVRACLRAKIEKRTWSPALSKSRQRHWFRALKANVCARLGNAFANDLLKGFDILAQAGTIPASRSI